MSILAKVLSQPAETKTYVPLEDLDTHLITDPRPDLGEDHLLWEDLLLRAYLHKEELAGVLHGLRCGGTRIRKHKGRFVLRPDVDLTGRVAWERKEDYEELRDKHLNPHRKIMIEILAQLTREEDHGQKRSS